ncbi:MAG TPA: ABC transporter permease [Candidatus Acidoferrales bacterium]|nr:ABC transporter permease [Candidatus Acidoferrales bacterium]
MRHALRVLGREKAFAAFAVLTLALGIGAVTTIFSVVDGVLLKPLAYQEPGRLYAAAESAPQLAAIPRLPVNAAHFRLWQEQCDACESGALVNPASFNLTGGGDPERVEGATCTWRLFEILGVAAQLGRTFVESDDQPGANQFVVISDSLWHRRLGGDPGAIGRPIRIDGVPHVVVGVLRPDFRFPAGEGLGPLNQFPKHPEIFKPMGFNWAKLSRVGQFNFAAVIRLRRGANPATASAEMTAAAADAGREMKIDLKAHLAPLQEQVIGGSRGTLTLLLSAVGAVLLIVCLNLGNLMLVRANERARDGAIRRALGAGAGDLFRPVLMESLLIAAAGGALGVLLAYAGVRVLAATTAIDVPRLDEVHVSVTTLLFALVVSASSGILCGLWPAIRMSGVQPAKALHSGSRSVTEGGPRLRAREWLVGAEVALSTVLLVGAALLGLSFLRVTNVERGYQVDHILTADLTLPGSRYQSDGQRARFHQQALEKLEATPGVRSAALVSSLPLKAQVWGDSISREGDTRPRAERPLANYRFVSEHYFESMGIGLRRGRFPAAADRSHKLAIVSESAARAVWPGENAVGKRIRNEPRAEWVEVIGVVADIRTESLEKQPPPMVYVPYWDGAYWQGAVWGNATYLVRTSHDPATMANAFRSALHEMDPELPLANMLTMREVLAESLGRRRFETVLAGVFAGAALVLACLGIYGVISYSVARRTNEIGIRIALGAQPAQVSMLVLRQGIRPVLYGLAAGVAAALAVGQLMRSFLFGTGPRDPAAISAVGVMLLVVAGLGCWAPARRASRIDPMAALKND